MDYISEIVTTGIIATLGMTAFSYIFSYIFKSNFKEPQLLNILIDRLQLFRSSIHREHILGWTIHFSIGMFFVIVFLLLLFYKLVDFSLITGLLFGLGAGLVGVCVWSFVFLVHRNPPDIKRWLFYIQLIIAHIIFGIIMIYYLGN